jgi:GT2 family glycosyltransferase
MKNESKVLKRMLESVSPIVDYYVVVDTGSTDDSKKIVKDFFDAKGIKGEIYDHPFVNFEDARNFALSKVKGKAEFGFWTDCDEQVIIKDGFNLDELKNLLSHNDIVMSNVLSGGSKFARRNFFRTDKAFRWQGKVHEILLCDEDIKISSYDKLEILVQHDGNSWTEGVKQKYLKHAEILEREVAKTNEPRDVFYLAQSYRDAVEPEKAIEWYKKRAAMTNGFYEERYYSQFMIGVQYQALNKPYSETIIEYLKCSELDTERAEHILNAIILLQNNGLWQSAYVLSKYAVEKFHGKLPANRLLFIHNDTYTTKLLLVHNLNLMNTGIKESPVAPTTDVPKNLTKIEKHFDTIKLSLIGQLTDKQNEKLFKGELSESEVDDILAIRGKLTNEQTQGLQWAYELPKSGVTMIGLKRLDNIQKCAIDIFEKNIDGDFIETGVWKGGATIFMAELLKKYNEKRNVYVCDSFEGLPMPEPDKYPADAGDKHFTFDYLKADLELVSGNFKRYGVLGDNIKFIKGWFCDTMPTLEIDKIAILRLDGDMYSSTWDVLEHLYHKLSIGGYLIIDDFALNGCRKAIEDFRSKFGIKDEIITIDKMGAYWKKTTEKQDPVQIDVCIISNAKNDELRKVTEAGIESLLASEKFIKFNVFVVESNKSVSYDKFPNTKTIYTDLPFGYHRYLNLARKQGNAPYVVLCNNDLTYEKNWASEILRAMDIDKNLLSVSPFCPQTQNKADYNQFLIYYGHEVRQQVAGWCIFQKREIYNIINELDEQFEFWFCDNDYATDIKTRGLKHALISTSVVNHHEKQVGNTASTLNEAEKKKITTDQATLFTNKWVTKQSKL